MLMRVYQSSSKMPYIRRNAQEAKERAWKARRLVTRCQGSNPSCSAIIKCRDTYK